MAASPTKKGRKVLQPSHPAVPTIPGHHGTFPETPCDHHRVRGGVRDGAGHAVMINDDNKPNDNLACIKVFNTYSTRYLSAKLCSWVPSGLIRVVVLDPQPPIR